MSAGGVKSFRPDVFLTTAKVENCVHHSDVQNKDHLKFVALLGNLSVSKNLTKTNYIWDNYHIGVNIYNPVAVSKTFIKSIWCQTSFFGATCVRCPFWVSFKMVSMQNFQAICQKVVMIRNYTFSSV